MKVASKDPCALLARLTPGADQSAYITVFEKIKELSEALYRKYGISIQCGAEIEFQPKVVSQIHEWDDSTSLFDTSTFTPSDHLMRLLLESPNTSSLLKNFNSKEEFYDAEGMLEANVLPVEGALLLTRLETVLEELKFNARITGTDIVDMSLHLSISFWKDGQNL